MVQGLIQIGISSTVHLTYKSSTEQPFPRKLQTEPYKVRPYGRQCLEDSVRDPDLYDLQGLQGTLSSLLHVQN